MNLFKPMMRFMVSLFVRLFSREPVKLAIVRRYEDANGSYVGELYMEQITKGITAYNMIGASLDSMPFEIRKDRLAPRDDFELDTDRDFLAHMPRLCVRVGALDPADNDRVRKMVARMPQKRMTLVIQNRFFMEPVVKPSGK